MGRVQAIGMNLNARSGMIVRVELASKGLVNKGGFATRLISDDDNFEGREGSVFLSHDVT
jgi:hypothetical protein